MSLQADSGKEAAALLGTWLKADGTFETGQGLTGSVDARGWRLEALGGRKPRLVKGEKGGPVLFGTGGGAWDDRFSLPGVDGAVFAIASTSTNVYVGGFFSNAGGVPAQNLARWNGIGWAAVGGGVDGPVTALALDGQNLWVGGLFSMAGSQSANNLATWNETAKSWTIPDAETDDWVWAILVANGVVYVGGEFAQGILATTEEGWAPPDDGMDGPVLALASSGPDVIAGGYFSSAGGDPANNIARLQLSDTNWVAMSSGVDGPVYALSVLATNALYAGGDFANAGGERAERIARWTGSAWQSVQAANGPITLRSVLALQARGSELFVGGDFDAPSGGMGNHVVKFDGTNWATLAAGVSSNVFAFATNSTGLFVGGEFELAGGLVGRGFAYWSEGGDLQKVGPGLNGFVNTVFVARDNEVYVGGEFTKAGTTNLSRIARWDGTNWFPLAEGVGGAVNAITSNGIDLFVGGVFTNAGTVAATNLARWNGTAWSAVGGGLNGPVRTLAVVGPILIAGGKFSQAGDAAASNIARWDGTNWSPLGDGFNDTVESVVVRWTDLHVGGAFTASGSTPLNHLARWDGRNWVALGEGVNGPVSALALTAAGDLVVGGRFTEAGTIRGANNIARWNGTSWSLLGIGLNGAVRSLHVMDGEVFAGGSFNNAGGLPVRNVARWIEANQAWALLLNLTNNGVDGNVFTVASTRTHVYLGGIFAATGGATNITRLQRSGWMTFGNGVGAAVEAIAVDNANIYAGGTFAYAGGVQANNVARWNGNNWSALGPGLGGPVKAIAVGEDGSVYAGGSFTNTGGLTVYRIARWDGFRWNPLGIGLDGPVLALAIKGTNLYAAGEFTRAGGFGASRVARWDGTRWSALGTGCNDRVRALALDGAGLVYAAGEFSLAGGVAVNRVARWDGARWDPLGAGVTNGLNNTVMALATVEEGLCAGGSFTSAGGRTNVAGVAFWDGSAWLALGQSLQSTNGNPIVRTLTTSPGGGVFAGGEFHRAGSAATSFLAFWNRTSWASVGTGLDAPASALAARGRELFVGGEFILAGNFASHHFARWVYTNDPPGIVFQSPGVGQVFTAPASILVSVDAYDLDGTVQNVQFFSGTNLLGNIANAPYQMAWTNVMPGIYSLSAKAFDNDGLATTTSPLLTIVNTNGAPYVALLTPTNGASIVAPLNLEVIVDARDADGSVVQLDLLSGSEGLASFQAPPYRFVWTNTPPGSYVLSARAVDNGGVTNTSTAVTVVVLPPEPATLTTVPSVAGQFELTLPGADGREVVIEAATDLIQWMPISTNTVMGGTLQFQDPEADLYEWRFYRVIQLPWYP